MILADKIIEERKRCGWSQEELANKLSVSRQSVSKWESAQSIPDLQRIVQMAELFGVSTDYLLKDEIESSVHGYSDEPVSNDAPLRKVSLEEANEYLALKQAGSRTVSRGVAMCILSPALLILLAGMANDGVAGVTEGIASIAGLAVLLVLVASAVYTFIMYGVKANRFEYLSTEGFETAYGVTGVVKEKQRAYEPVFSRGVAVGVVLCILAALPLLVATLAGAPEFLQCALVSLLLVLVASGVYITLCAWAL